MSLKVEPISYAQRAHKRWSEEFSESCKRFTKNSDFIPYEDPYDDIYYPDFFDDIDFNIAQDSFDKDDVPGGILALRRLGKDLGYSLDMRLESVIDRNIKKIREFEDKFAKVADKALAKGDFLKGALAILKISKMSAGIDGGYVESLYQNYIKKGLAKAEELFAKDKKEEAVTLINDVRCASSPATVRTLAKKLNLVNKNKKYCLPEDIK